MVHADAATSHISSVLPMPLASVQQGMATFEQVVTALYLGI